MSIFDSLKNVAASVTSSTAGTIVDSISNGISKFVNTPEDKEKAAEFTANMKQAIQTELDAHQEKMATLYEQSYGEQLKDVQSARDMQIEALKQGNSFAKNFVNILACVYIVFCFSWAVCFFFVNYPPANRDMINTITGVIVGTGLVSVIGFYFGSSKDASDKSKTIEDIAKS
jgi:hypothetical protein